MKTYKLVPMLALLAGMMTIARAQDTPQDVPKKELPKKAVCLVCSQNGENEEEKPAGGVRYKGKTYYFCNMKEVADFKKDPASALPLPLPRSMPKFTLKTLTEDEVTPETYKEKFLLVDFWATWCKPCVATMPELQKLHDKYAEKGLAVLGVSIDEKGAKVVKPFVAKRKFTYPILLDGGDKPAWQQFGVRGVPALYLVNKEGEIVKQWGGKPDKKEVEEAVKELLK